MTTIKSGLAKIISFFPGGKSFLRKRTYINNKRWFTQIGDAKKVFRHHYETNTWGSAESASGPGSTIEYTEKIRRILPRLISDLGISMILDAPCGDYNWFKLIQWEKNITYIGGDIVEPLTARNQALYGSANTRFINLDIIHDALPKVDMWLCRDCLFHLSDNDVMLALNNFLRSDIHYLLTSTHPDCDRNYDIPTGSFRLLNLQLPPYSLCNPIRAIDDWIEGYPIRHLALWDRESLRNNLASNKKFMRITKHCR